MRKKVVELDRQVSDILAERDDLQRAGQAKDKDLQTLKTSVYERDSLISELETQLEMLRSTSNVSHDEMLAACESDKVAASRAMVQNKQLKEQLTELENQFIQLVSFVGGVGNDIFLARCTLPILSRI